MVDASVPGKRRRGRQKTRGKDSCKRDVESMGLNVEGVHDRTKWKREIQNYSGDLRQDKNIEYKPQDKKTTKQKLIIRTPFLLPTVT